MHPSEHKQSPPLATSVELHLAPRPPLCKLPSHASRGLLSSLHPPSLPFIFGCCTDSARRKQQRGKEKEMGRKEKPSFFLTTLCNIFLTILPVSFSPHFISFLFYKVQTVPRKSTTHSDKNRNLKIQSEYTLALSLVCVTLEL